MPKRLTELSVRDILKRAEMHYSRGMYSLARDDYAAVLAEGHSLEVPQQAELRWRLAMCCVVLGRNDEADAVLELAGALPQLPAIYAPRFAAVRGFAALSRGDYDIAREVLRGSVEAMRGHGDREGLVKALRWLAQTHLRTGDLESAFSEGYCALSEARALGADADAGHAHSVLCVALMQRGQYEPSISHGREALEIATRLGHQVGIIRHNLNLSVAIRLSGDLDLAATHALRALAAAEEADVKVLVINARLAAARALRESGRLEPARELVEGALDIAQKSERERDHVLVLEDLGDLDYAAGKTRAALEKYRVAWRKAERIAAEGDLVAELGWRIGLAQLELGDTEGAKSWIDKSLEVGEKAGERKELALALRARGVWNASVGHEPEARVDFESALGELETLRVPYELGRTHLAYAKALAECAGDSEGTVSERRRHLAAARRLFERIGAERGLRDTVEAEIRLVAGREVERVSRGTASDTRGAKALGTEWQSAAFRASLDECTKLGPTSLPILLTGSTGTGKTILAEALHALGRGQEGEFFPVNCAAMPDHLQESELFGHRKGAFTGADREHPGILREAGRGTVLLDEIDKTSLEFQAKLLHVLDNYEVRPVGSTRRVPVEARIICATNRDLFALVEAGKFLEDLHHRLMGGVIEVPKLRDRLEDLELLSSFLLNDVCGVERIAVPELTNDAWAVLRGHDWPGNVRELRSLLHRTIALNREANYITGEMILSSAPKGSTIGRDRTASAGPTPKVAVGLAERMENAERDEILRALDDAGGVRRKAAEMLGVSYRGLGKKMVRLGIDAPPRSRD